jgi:Prolyl oligopeptidase family
MRKKILALTLVITQGISGLFAQKKLLTHFTAGTWPTIDRNSTAVSDDGKYIEYRVDIPDSGSKLYVQSIDHFWRKQFCNVYPTNGRCLIANKLLFIQGKDSLGIVELGTDTVSYTSGVSGFTLPQEGNAPFVAYKKNDPDDTLVLINLNLNVYNYFLHVDQFLFNKKGKVIVYSSSDPNTSGKEVHWLDLTTGKNTTICHAATVNGLNFNDEGTALAFFSQQQSGNQQETAIRYYAAGMDSTGSITGNTRGMGGMPVNLGYCFFSENGLQLFFEAKKSGENQKKQITSDTSADLSISLPGNIDEDADRAKGALLATIDLGNIHNGVILLQKAHEHGVVVWDNAGNWFITESNVSGDPRNNKWDIKVRPDIYLVSTKTGERRLLKSRLLGGSFQFSPSGKYVIWFDAIQRQWYSHSVLQNKTKNITGEIKDPLYIIEESPDYPGPFDFGGWLNNDSGMLLYGQQDIWLIDPAGVRAPVNLTHGYGKTNAIQFRLLKLESDKQPVISSNDTLILSAFDLRTKQDGFFRLLIGNGHLEKLVMSSHVYTGAANSSIDLNGYVGPQPVIKAKNANLYLLGRMSATQYPNLYITGDFKNFEAVTDMAPQKAYNWYTSELIHWKLPDGKPAEGLLYKPETFDSSKKYPLIFYYYYRNTNCVNCFIRPELSRGDLDVPWFVGHGYLVCVPDIYYQIGYPGRSALNSVESAAKYLSQKPWVDAKNMGLQGHSFGGFETNYIISHSTLFKAASPASGMSNAVQAYGDLFGPYFFESRQGRIGATLWQRPDLYIENSPVFKADKVIAAVLIMHTYSDNFSYALQWYRDLHRLDKKVWMLDYEGNENHTLEDPRNQLDYAIRLGQFFDYELKGAPEPKWMTNVTKPSKGNMGYELNTSGARQ